MPSPVPAPSRAPRRAGGAAAAALLLAAAGCTFGGGEDVLTVWTPYGAPERLAQQQATADRFTEESGIEVEVVPMAAADQNRSLASGAAAGDVPDLVLAGPEQVAVWSAEGLLDTEVPGEVLDALGPETFDERAVAMASPNGTLAAVPSDGWGQVLVYRTDLFEAAGLAPPESTEDAARAAEALNTDGVAGIVLGTRPGDPFTAQTLEALLVGSGCALVDADGAVALESPECTAGIESYGRMADASVQGDQDAASARDAYLAGEAAMVLWSSHLLGPIAGAAPDTPPSCDECDADPSFLAENSGVVGALRTPQGDTAQYGRTLNLAVPSAGDTAAAQQYAEFLLHGGYEESLAIAPEGRVPMRSGTPADPDRFTSAWEAMPAGGNGAQPAPLSDSYDPATVQAVADGAESFQRWGAGDDAEHAAFAGALAAESTLAQEVPPLFGNGDPAPVARNMARSAAQVQSATG